MAHFYFLLYEKLLYGQISVTDRHGLIWFGVQFFPSQIIISHNKESCRQAFIGSAADQTGDFFSPLEGANVFGCYMIRQIRDHTGEREEAWQRKQFTVE